MSKKVFIIGLLIILIVAIGFGVWWVLIPKTPDAQLAKAEKLYLKTELLIPQLEKKSVPKEKIQSYWQKTLQEYQKVLDRFPKSEQAPMALLKQGMIYEENLNQADAAIAIYKKLIQTYPESTSATEALYRKAGLLADVKKEGPAELEAIEDLKRLINKSPTSQFASKAQFKIGSIYENIKEYQQAVDEYQKVVDNYPTSEEAPQAQYRIGQISQQQLGNTKEAQNAYDKLVQKYPSSKWAKVAPALKGKLASEEESQKASDQVKKYYGTREAEPSAQPFRREELILEEKVRETNIAIKAYRLQFKFTPLENKLECHGEFDAVNNGAATSELRFKLNQSLKINFATVNGKPARVEQDKDLLKIFSAFPIKSGAFITIGVDYAGKQDDSESWTSDVIGTEGVVLKIESKWYPQSGWGNLATSDLMIEVPSDYAAVAGGMLMDSKDLKDTKIFHWQNTVPVFGLVVAAREYDVESDKLNGLPIMTYFYKSDSEKSKAYLQEAKQIMQFYTERFGAYPYSKLAIAEIPYFPGGYGSPSLVLLTETAFGTNSTQVSLLAHEISHQWWGNLLNIQLHEDSVPWLNEGFATYSDCLYLEHKDGKPAMQKHLALLAEGYRESALSGGEESILASRWGTRNYQPTVYYKGAHVLHALRYVVGDEKFFMILKNYIRQYAGKTVSVKDFQTVCEQVYGQSLGWFFEEWLGRTGLPSFKISNMESAKSQNGYKVTMQIVQDGTFYKMPIDMTILTSAGPVTQRVTVDQMVTPVEILTKAEPLSAQLDKDNWILQAKGSDDISRKVVLKK